MKKIFYFCALGGSCFLLFTNPQFVFFPFFKSEIASYFQQLGHFISVPNGTEVDKFALSFWTHALGGQVQFIGLFCLILVNVWVLRGSFHLRIGFKWGCILMLVTGVSYSIYNVNAPLSIVSYCSIFFSIFAIISQMSDQKSIRYSIFFIILGVSSVAAFNNLNGRDLQSAVSYFAKYNVGAKLRAEAKTIDDCVTNYIVSHKLESLSLAQDYQVISGLNVLAFPNVCSETIWGDSIEKYQPCGKMPEIFILSKLVENRPYDDVRKKLRMGDLDSKYFKICEIDTAIIFAQGYETGKHKSESF